MGSAWRWRKLQHCVQCVCLSETKLCSINSKYGVHQYRQQTGTDFMVLFLLWCCQFMSQVGRWFMPRWFEIDLYSLICLLWEIMILNVMYIQKALAYLGFFKRWKTLHSSVHITNYYGEHWRGEYLSKDTRNEQNLSSVFILFSGNLAKDWKHWKNKCKWEAAVAVKSTKIESKVLLSFTS